MKDRLNTMIQLLSKCLLTIPVSCYPYEGTTEYLFRNCILTKTGWFYLAASLCKNINATLLKFSLVKVLYQVTDRLWSCAKRAYEQCGCKGMTLSSGTSHLKALQL